MWYCIFICSIFDISNLLLYQDLYNAWCKDNKFNSKLPKAAKAAKEKQRQTLLDGHLKEIPTSELVKPYSDSVFREAAIEWLIATDQVKMSPHFYQNSHLTMGSISLSRLSNTQNSVI